MAIKLTDLLNRIPSDTKQKVESVKKEVVVEIKKIIQSDCNLKLDLPSTSIKILPGCPTSIKEIEFPDDVEIFHLLCQYRHDLENAKSGCQGIRTLLMDNSETLEKIQDPKIIELDESLDRNNIPDNWISMNKKRAYFVTQLADILLSYISDYRIEESKDVEHPLKRILSIDEDILGIYRCWANYFDDDLIFNDAQIHVYWAVLGLASLWLPCKVEDLTVKVLAHELAHAYTQLGADSESRIWNVNAFLKTDRQVLEGLAQYYTHFALKKLPPKFSKYSSAFEVYENLLPHQHAIYKTHQPWIKKFKQEDVRLAMLKFRRARETKWQHFEKRLETASQQLNPIF